MTEGSLSVPYIVSPLPPIATPRAASQNTGMLFVLPNWSSSDSWLSVLLTQPGQSCWDLQPGPCPASRLWQPPAKQALQRIQAPHSLGSTPHPGFHLGSASFLLTIPHPTHQQTLSAFPLQWASRTVLPLIYSILAAPPPPCCSGYCTGLRVVFSAPLFTPQDSWSF